MSEYQYVGTELHLFAEATNWKRYFGALIQPYLGKDVLEVGAGTGGTTRLLCSDRQRLWLGLEPDAALVQELEKASREAALPPCFRPALGTVADLPDGHTFDTILYVDVLEHIEDDAGELARSALHLVPGGHLIVLSPAHQWLSSAFDAAIGHHRRYNRRSLAALTPESLTLVRLLYVDAVGLLASLGNRLLLRRAMPTARQIAVWDKTLIPLSRRLDPLLGHSLGKTALGVWRKRA